MKKASLCAAVVVLSCGLALGQYKVLYSFGTNGGSSDGANPAGTLIFDTAGNIYGTTSGGGIVTTDCPSGCGTVFELSPVEGGGWSETLIYEFTDGADGQNPAGGLTFDSQGNLYGATGAGPSPDCGTIFELTPALDGTWTETTLYAFNCHASGYGPNGPLILDADGNLYGTTAGGGANGYGTVFELSPPVILGGAWTETILYNLCQVKPGDCLDGANPLGGLVFDKAGNLYGTTLLGGGHKSWGLVFELSPNQNGGWTGRVIYNFDGAYGGNPEAGLSFDSVGRLYGTMESGGSENEHCAEEGVPPYAHVCGGIFQLWPGPNNSWTETSVLLNGKDGGNPTAPVVVGANAVYGTAGDGAYSRGVVFKVDHNFMTTTLHRFCTEYPCADGSVPYGGLTINGGRLYGTTLQGGAYDTGVVFEIAP